MHAPGGDGEIDTGPFELVGELGRGGMGVVYEVRDDRGAHLALKAMREVAPRDILRIKTEFRALRDVQHPNLVRLGELVEHEGRWFFTMELVEGVDLLTWVRGEEAPAAGTATDVDGSPDDPTAATVADKPDDGRTTAPMAALGKRAAPSFDEPRLRAALRGLVDGLAALHQAGLVHRDIKPSNIKVTPEGRVVILDFGVVAELTRAPASEVVGTWAYMAPEQAAGKISTASDWYAVGVILYRALTGQLPRPRAPRGSGPVRAPVVSPDDLVADLPEDLVALCLALLADDPLERAGEREVRAAVGGALPLPATSVHAPPFVGRVGELERLHALAARQRAEGARAIVITGESGLGKTAVARRFVNELAAAHRDLIILEGRCDPRELVAHNALDGVVDDLARELGFASDRTTGARAALAGGELARVFPVLGTIAARRPSAIAVASADQRAAAARELARALAALARSGPVLVFIDDLHWADADSLRLLGDLFGDAPPPVLLLATSRGRVAELALPRRIPVDEIALAGLSGDDARRLAAAVGGGGVDVDAVVRDTAGHPMFIAEVARHAVERAPGGLDDALWARAGELDRPARDALEAIVVGAGLSRDVIADAVGLDDAVLDDAIARLRTLRLVRSSRERGGALEPYHDRVREALYTRLPRPRRDALHAGLAAVLAARDGAPELLAHHLAAAGDHEAAAHHAVRAAERATDALAFERAAGWYATALELGAYDGDRRRALLVARGDVLDRAGRPRDAGEAFLAAAEAGALDPVVRLELRRRAAEQLLAGGYLDEGMAVARELLDELGLSVPAGQRGIARLLWRDLRLRLTPLRWTSRRAEEVPPIERVRADASWSAATRLSMIDTIQGAAHAARTPILCLRTGEPWRIARSLAASAMAAAIMGQRRRLPRFAEAIARAVEELDVPEARCYLTLVDVARAMFLDGDWPRTGELAALALDEWRAAGRGLGWESDLCEQFIGWTHLATGDIAQLRRHTERVVAGARRAGNRFLEVTFRIQFPAIHLLDDDVDTAAADLEDAYAAWPVPAGLDVQGNQFFWAVKTRAVLACYRGELERDAAALEAQWAAVWRSVLARVPSVALEAALWEGDWRIARAVEARDRGDRSAMAEHLARAGKLARVLRRLPTPVGAELATRLGVFAAAARGELDEVRRRLPGVIDALAARQMNGMAAAARSRLGALLGGDEGAALLAHAAAFWAAQGVARPDRFEATLAPGWPHPSRQLTPG